MPYTLPALTYDYAALEPHIDTQTMQLHHDKHHQTYVDKLNAALVGHDDLATLSIEDLLKGFATIPEEIKTAVKNHGGGHSNHSIFWTILSPTTQEPSEILKAQITKDFGTWEAFVEKFNAAAGAHFGSGWVWLIKDKSGKLSLQAYANQDSPYLNGDLPLMGIDVWEHAYYLKYQNRRPEYIAAFWKIINWSEVEKRFGLTA